MNAFISTAISYPNGVPHVGHLYESLLADFYKTMLTRYYDKVYLQTGVDEHGRKMELTAKVEGISIQELCERNSQKFIDLNKAIGTQYDNFIRTSIDVNHKKLVIDTISTLITSGDVYLGTYSGWYSVREETYYTDTEAKLCNYLDPATSKPLEQIKEPTYFFKMEKYRSRIIEWLEEGNVIKPFSAFQEILSRLKESLKDLSITRTKNLTWGIHLDPLDPLDRALDPLGLDHVVYVWFDALLNYITGMKITGISYKPIHVIGCDILWFHAVVYPAILMASGMIDTYLPREILVHGFINDATGHKMSKSVGNVVGVDEVLSRVSIPALRYYLLSSAHLGDCISFNIDMINQVFRSELVANYGNLVQRVMGCVKKDFTHMPTKEELDHIPSFGIWDSIPVVDDFFLTYDAKSYIQSLLYRSSSLNKLLHDMNLSKELTPIRQQRVIDFVIHIIDLTKLMLPIAPTECAKVLDAFTPLKLIPSTFKVFEV